MNRFAVLDGWRGICAILVALFHLSAASHIFYFPPIRNAGAFVDFFFVLSGFVLAHAYNDRVTTPGDAADFLVRRVGRLWPLHIFMLSLFVGLECVKWGTMAFLHVTAGDAPFTGPTEPFAIATNILLVHSLGLHSTYTWNGPSWSISTELWANVVFALTLVAFRRHLLLCSILIIALSIGTLETFNHGSLGATYDYGIFKCLYGFFAGVITYALHEKLHKGDIPLSSLVEIATLIGIGAYVSCLHLMVTDMFTPVVFGFSVFLFARERGSVSRLMKTKPFHYLGQWSFSIYLVHAFVLAIIGGTSRVLQQLLHINLMIPTAYQSHKFEMLTLGNAWMMDLFTIAYLALVVSISALTYRYVEEPGRAYFNGLAKRRVARRQPQTNMR
ncbi:acyltransferase [Parvibaculum sp.]|uniref:acyltransferase family protein n=1 Tax=Parvibaculum sp. TaxID=2024848 RepID=UPI00320C03B3